jgi:hypothetical protein
MDKSFKSNKNTSPPNSCILPEDLDILKDSEKDVERKIKERIIIETQKYIDIIAKLILDSCQHLIHEIPNGRPKDNGNHIDTIIRIQAHLIWHKNGRRPNDKKGMEDDWFDAKRYIYFLFVDNLLKSCHSGNACPLDSFTLNSAEYMQSLTIEEFAKFKAYLKWKDRTGGNIYIINSEHSNDYYDSIKYVKKIAAGCDLCKRLLKNSSPLSTFISSNKFNVDKIETAKCNYLTHKNKPTNKEIVHSYMENYYNVVKEHHKEGFSQNIVKQLQNQVNATSHDVATIFELVLNCYISSIAN